MKIFFASNARFGKIILQKMLELGVKVDAVVTAPDKRKGRGGEVSPLPIKVFAHEEKIDVYEADEKEEFHQIIEKEKPDVVIVAGFKIIILSKTLQKTLFINVHPSALPAYRGPTPIQKTILSGDSVGGVSIIKMNEKVDYGPVIKAETVQLSDDMSYLQLEEFLAVKAGEMMKEVISLIENKELKFSEQDDERASFTSKIAKEDGLVNWSEPALFIERKVRAYNPWPGTYTYINGKMLKIIEAEVQQQTGVGPFGDPGKTYLGTNGTIAVQTGKDFLLIKKLQLEGKNPVLAKEFVQGNFSLLGAVLSSEK